jgi:hypothetical protein
MNLGSGIFEEGLLSVKSTVFWDGTPRSQIDVSEEPTISTAGSKIKPSKKPRRYRPLLSLRMWRQ